MIDLDLTKPYNKYAHDVLNHKIEAPQTIVQACQRYVDWYKRNDIYFDDKDVDQKIRFVSKLKHSTGQFAGKPFILMGWQTFVFANVYGWKWKSNNLRVTKKVFLFMSRKNAKTSTIAALAIIGSLIDKEAQAEVDIVANSHRQAEIAFNQIYQYIKSIDPNKKLFSTTRQNIKIPYSNSVIQVHAADSMSLDGYNSSIGIIDEFHAQKSWDLYNVLMSSMAMRRQPLMFVITTAGFLVGEEYPCYNLYQKCKSILNNQLEDDTQFSLIYELDKQEEIEDESKWIKASPSLGETVRYEYLREQLNDVKNNPSLEVGVLTKNFNCWMNGANTWLRDEDIKACMQNVDLQKLVGHQCYAGVDLSAVSDLTAWSVMFPPDASRDYYPDKFIFKSLCYLPEETIETSPNRDQYKTFIPNKHLINTPGNLVDYDIILEDQQSVDQAMVVHTWAYDSYNATQWALNAQAKGMNLVPFSQSLSNFNRPTKEFERLLKQGKIIIDSSLLTLWCFRNVELKFDWNDNVKPVKANLDLQNKIDPVISMLEALGAYLADTDAADPD